jgi:glutaconate CoA-transferase subunit B
MSGISNTPGRAGAPSVCDLLVAVLARQVRGGDVVGVGLGTPLALCAALVARRTHAPDAEVLVGGAVSPNADLLTCMRGAAAIAGRTAGFVPHLDTMDMAERQVMTLQFLRPAQIDGEGSINTSRVTGPDGRVLRMPGGLAMADVPRLMPRVVLYHTDHRPRSLVSRLDAVTGRGGASERGGFRSAGPTVLVTDRCVIGIEAEGPRLVSVHPGESVEGIVAATGFPLRVAGRVPETEPPTAAELAAMEQVDPHALRGVETRDTRAEAAARLIRLLEEEPAHA